MLVATWNVNSIRARLERLIAFLERHQPDVVCLQETKVIDAAFPVDEIADAGYQCAVSGQKTYNGVAILARSGLEEVQRGFEDGGDDSEARHVAATVDGVRIVSVYVPNGRSVGTEAYAFKLEWLARLRRWLDKKASPAEDVIVTGDFNVAPADPDVHDPDAWRDEVLCSEPERAALREIQAWGLVDAFREKYPDDVVFTWWDYRRLGFPKNRGLRIDHVLVTAPLFERLSQVRIDRDERKGKGASDHAPVLATFG